MAEAAVRLLCETFGATRVEWLVGAPGDPAPSVRAAAGCPGGMTAGSAPDEGDRALFERVRCATQPILIRRRAATTASAGTTSIVAVPVRTGESFFGALCAYRALPFTRADAGFAAAAAAVLGLECERERLTDRLAASSEQARRLGGLVELVTETLPVSLAYIDADGIYRWANRRHAERHGLTVEQLVGRRVIDVWGAPVYRETLAERVERVLGGETVTYERPVRHADGSIRDSHVTLTPAFGRDGRVEGFASLSLDISERRRVERALEGAEESRRFLASIVEQSLDCILTRDCEDVITSWNPGARRMLGWSAEEAVGRRSTDLHLRAMAPEVRARMQERIRGGQPAQFEVTWLARDDTQRHVLATFAPMHDDAGRHIGEIVIARDVSELREARAALERLNDELEHRVVERTTQLASAHQEAESLSYSIAHDLRAPLRAISGYTRILSQEASLQTTADARGYLDRVAANAERMGTLIDALLAFGHLSRAPLERTTISLNEAVTDALGWLAAEQTGRPLVIEIADLGTAQADPALIRVALANLLSNALKFTRGCDPARIEVGLTAQGAGPVYHVRDNGVGFDMRYADKLFGMFQRLHGVKEFEGSGVGLASVQRIVQRHGGRIWAEGAVGQGATFRFTLGAE